MFAMFLIAFREGLEAVLVVSIILGVLTRVGWHGLKRWVWAGAGLALLTSLLASGLLMLLDWRLEGGGKEVFEGVMMLTAAGLLTWMIFWMRYHGRALARALATKTETAVQRGGHALAALAFFAVVREGLETALLFIAASLQSARGAALVGGVLGLGAAIVLGMLLYRASVYVPVGMLFDGTGLLLLLVAAGLVAGGVRELQDAGWLPIFIEHLWDTGAVMSETGVLGGLFKALFGYHATPSFLEVLVYFIYLVLVGFLGWGALARRPAA